MLEPDLRWTSFPDDLDSSARRARQWVSFIVRILAFPPPRNRGWESTSYACVMGHSKDVLSSQ